MHQYKKVQIRKFYVPINNIIDGGKRNDTILRDSFNEKVETRKVEFSVGKFGIEKRNIS